MEYQLYPLSDHAIVIELGKKISEAIQQKIQLITSFLDDYSADWMIAYIPAFTTVTIFYDPMKLSSFNKSDEMPYDQVCHYIDQFMSGLIIDKPIESRVVEIPVCYGGELGPDIAHVAKSNGLTVEEVIHIHTSGTYTVHMIGFAPGFPYIGGMSDKIATPRRGSPRLKIPARSVGIADSQTGIYPIETPGGWQLIGRTPRQLFLPERHPPSLLKAGDKIRFKPITYQAYMEWGTKHADD